MEKKKYKVFLFLFLAGMLPLHVVIAWSSVDRIRKGYPDFTAFYSGASIVRQGLGGQLYDEQTQYQVQQQFASEVSIRQGPLPYTHPPFETLLFIPFTWVSYSTAYVLWDLVNLSFLVMLFYLLRTAVPWLRQISVAFWLLGCLAFFPVFFALLHGQDTLLLTLLLGAVYVLLQRNSDIAAGCCLGLGVFRFHLILPLVLMLLCQRRTKALFGFVTVAAVLLVLSVAITGWQGVVAYPSLVWHQERALELRLTTVPSEMANVRGLLDSLLIPRTSKLVADIVTLMVSIALIFFAASKWKLRGRAESDLGFALCLVVTVLVGYHTLAHDLSLLLIPAALTIQQLCQNVDIDRRDRLLLLVSLFLLFFSPLHALLALRSRHYNLFALVLLFWCWVLSRSIAGRDQAKLQE